MAAAAPRTMLGQESLHPVVTVVTAVWDGYSDLLPACVQSALTQRGIGVEVVVVDNASEVPLPALDQQVRVVRTPIRVSAGAARNVGLAHVRTPLVLFLDADDALLDGSLARLAEVLDRDSGAVAAVGKHLLWSPVTGQAKVVARSPRPLVYRIARRRRLMAALTLRFDCYPLVGCAVIRTQTARDAGGFGDGDLAEDWVLRSALAFRGRIAFSSQPAVRVSVCNDSLWHREHPRAELAEMYARFRSARLADRRLPLSARAVMPLIAAAQRRDVARLAGAGSFKPPSHGLTVAGLERRGA